MGGGKREKRGEEVGGGGESGKVDEGTGGRRELFEMSVELETPHMARLLFSMYSFTHTHTQGSSETDSCVYLPLHLCY